MKLRDLVSLANPHLDTCDCSLCHDLNDIIKTNPHIDEELIIGPKCAHCGRLIVEADLTGWLHSDGYLRCRQGAAVTLATPREEVPLPQRRIK